MMTDMEATRCKLYAATGDCITLLLACGPYASEQKRLVLRTIVARVLEVRQSIPKATHFELQANRPTIETLLRCAAKVAPCAGNC